MTGGQKRGKDMNKLGEKICKHKKLIIIFTVILLIPALIGMYKTKINYGR